MRGDLTRHVLLFTESIILSNLAIDIFIGVGELPLVTPVLK